MWKANKIDELRKQGGKPTGDAAGASGASAGQGVYVPKKNAAAEGIAGKGKEYEQQYGGKHYDLGNGKDVAAAHQKVSKVTGGAEGSDDAMSFDNVPESEALKATYNTDVNPPIKTTNLNNGSQHKGTHIKQNISGGRGYSNKVMYIDDNVTVTYSLRLIRDTTCFTLKTSGTYTESDDNGTHVKYIEDTIDFRGFYYEGICRITNRKGLKLAIKGAVMARPNINDMRNITATGPIGACFGFDKEFPPTYWDDFYNTWDFTLTNPSFVCHGKFWTEIPDEIPSVNIKYEILN